MSSSSKLDLQHSTAHGTSGFSQREHARTVPTVLLADDHIELLQAVARMLEGNFEVVATAKDGRRALELAHNLSPDVLLLDISMPLMNGIEAALHLKEEGSSAKVVFLTVHDDRDFVEAAMSAGALGYILKQRLAADLILGLKTVLDGDTFVSSSTILQ